MEEIDSALLCWAGTQYVSVPESYIWPIISIYSSYISGALRDIIDTISRPWAYNSVVECAPNHKVKRLKHFRLISFSSLYFYFLGKIFNCLIGPNKKADILLRIVLVSLLSLMDQSSHVPDMFISRPDHLP